MSWKQASAAARALGFVNESLMYQYLPGLHVLIDRLLLITLIQRPTEG